jgi:hypothetical protein
MLRKCGLQNDTYISLICVLTHHVAVTVALSTSSSLAQKAVQKLNEVWATACVGWRQSRLCTEKSIHLRFTTIQTTISLFGNI